MSRVTKKWRPGKRVMLFSNQGLEDDLMNHIGVHFGLAWATITGHIEAAEALAGRGKIDRRVLNAVNALVESGVENAMLSPVRRPAFGLSYQFAEDIMAGCAFVALERESFYVDRRCA